MLGNELDYTDKAVRQLAADSAVVAKEVGIRGANVATGTLSITAGLVMCEIPGGIIVGAPMIASGINDYVTALGDGRGGFELLTGVVFDQPQIGKGLDTVLIYSGTAAVYKAPVKYMLGGVLRAEAGKDVAGSMLNTYKLGAGD